MRRDTPGFRLEFETENDAFENGNRCAEVARILRDVASKIESGEALGGGSVYDENDNRVGHWEMTPFR